MWKLYDELIAQIPDDLRVAEGVIGLHWTMVRSRTVGMAMTPVEGARHVTISGGMAGMPVRELAGYVKSWNNYEAALGLAAINSALNTAERFAEIAGDTVDSQPVISAFDYFQDRLAGKKVAVIGHFPHMQKLASIAELSVIERRPQPGDLPDPVSEYILPEQDFVFVTATTLVNKTLPRLLELSKQAHLVLLGPGTPLTTTMFEHGVDTLSGSLVVDEAMIWRTVQEGAHQQIFKHGGRMFQLTREAWLARKSCC